MDIILIQSTARLRRMSWRRQKIAHNKMPRKVFKNVHPISVGNLGATDCGERVEFEVKFSFNP